MPNQPAKPNSSASGHPPPWKWVKEELRDGNGKGIPFDWLRERVLLMPEVIAVLEELRHGSVERTHSESIERADLLLERLGL